MTFAAASDTMFALLDGAGLLAGIEGTVQVGASVTPGRITKVEWTRFDG